MATDLILVILATLLLVAAPVIVALIHLYSQPHSGRKSDTGHRTGVQIVWTLIILSGSIIPLLGPLIYGVSAFPFAKSDRARTSSRQSGER